MKAIQQEGEIVMNKGRVLLLVVFIILYGVITLPARASSVVYDDFDDGILDSAWSITFQDSTGWVYTETGTKLNVTDIFPTVINSGGGGTWAKVMLSQTFTPINDFIVNFDFSWDSEESLNSMQIVNISLYDTDGSLISWAGYYDPWLGSDGSKHAWAEDYWASSGPNSLPFSGSAFVDISRIGGNTEVFWDGVSFASSTNATPLSKVEIVFWYYASNRPSGNSFFGNESVDFLAITELEPIILDFDIIDTSITGTAQLSNEFQSQGVIFSSFNPSTGITGPATVVEDSFGGNGAVSLPNSVTFGYQGQIVTATFVDPITGTPNVTSFVSAQVGDKSSEVDPITMTAFDINGNVIGSSYFTSEFLGHFGTVMISVPGIHRVEFSNASPSGADFDDFTYAHPTRLYPDLVVKSGKVSDSSCDCEDI
jgi:hypothetical protein